MNNEIEQIEQVAQESGNTIALSKPQTFPYTYWFFTYNNYEDNQIEQLEQIFKSECKWFVFQEEKGENGTPHLQGTIALKVKQRLTQLKKIDPKIHWENTKSVKASIEYCTKYETRAGKIYTYGIEIPEQVVVEEPYGWQTQVLSILASKPDSRTIYWFWENKGNVGKSTLCKYLVVKKQALMLTGKGADMFHMLATFPNKRKIIICDIPRSSLGYINYGAIEQIKNGLVFSGKYEGAQLAFNCPHVICFANEPPNEDQMSKDRWNIIPIVLKEAYALTRDAVAEPPFGAPPSRF